MRKKSEPKTITTAIRLRISGLVQPILLPWVTTICSATMVTMKVSTPAKSNLYAPLVSALLSGVPFIISRPMMATTIEAKKM